MVKALSKRLQLLRDRHKLRHDLVRGEDFERTCAALREVTKTIVQGLRRDRRDWRDTLETDLNEACRRRSLALVYKLTYQLAGGQRGVGRRVFNQPMAKRHDAEG